MLEGFASYQVISQAKSVIIKSVYEDTGKSFTSRRIKLLMFLNGNGG
jgi:hypothetical protein